MQNGEGLIVGIDLGGTKIHAAAVSEAGELLGDARCKTRPEDGVEAVIGRMGALVREIADGLHSQVRAVCVGVPGGVDAETGMVDEAPNLGWRDVPLSQKLGALTGAPVFLDNDVRVAVIGEHAHGAGRGTRSMIGVWVGTGIGGGLILDGELHRGGRGVAGEVGHMTLDPKGPRCSCGRRGCAEAFASRTAMERDLRALLADGRKSKAKKLMKKEGHGRLTSSVIADALKGGDKPMRKVLTRAQKWLAILVGNLVNAFDPEVVVVGGGLAERLGEELVGPIRKQAMERFLVQRDRDRVRIVATELGDKSAPIGAAFVARRRLTRSGTHATVA